MNIKKEMQDLLDSCGGEDLLRYLLKDEGVEDWETVILHPIVAYSPPYMSMAEICGIAYWNGVKFEIIHSEEIISHANFERWIESVMEERGLAYEAEALLEENRAIIATPQIIDEVVKGNKSWEGVVLEVMYGYRANNFGTRKTYNLSNEISMLSSFFDILMDVKKEYDVGNSTMIPKRATLDFPEDFKTKWA